MYRAMNAADRDTVRAVYDRESARIDRLNVEYDRHSDRGKRQTGSHGNTVIHVP